MHVNYFSVLLLATLPLAIAGGGDKGPGGDRVHGDIGGHPSLTSGERGGKGAGGRPALGDVDASPTQPFRIIPYDASGVKQYFTQPVGSDETCKLYQTSDISESEIFQVNAKHYLWYNSTNQYLPGPLYSFQYPDTLTPPPAIAFAGLFTAPFIQNPIIEADFDIWNEDFVLNTLTLVRPAGLAMITCPESVDWITSANVWYMATQPFTPSNGCREIAWSIEIVE